MDPTPATVEALRNLQAKRNVVSLGGDDLALSNENDEPRGYFYLRDVIKRIAPKNITIHSLSHTCSNVRLLAKGDNALDVSRQLGHHKVAFIIDKYDHWIPGEHKSQVDDLNNLHLSAPYTYP